MNKVFKSAMVVLGLTGAAFAASGSVGASAAGVSIDFGNVAFAYSDGYWDNDHHWHHWHNAREAHAYRAAHRSDYHAWKHDRDHDQGWKR